MFLGRFTRVLAKTFVAVASGIVIYYLPVYANAAVVDGLPCLNWERSDGSKCWAGMYSFCKPGPGLTTLNIQREKYSKIVKCQNRLPF